MFESTLEAQAQNDSERRFGTFSVVVFAHLAIIVAMAIVAALTIPPIKLPEPRPVLYILAAIPLGDFTPRPVAPAPTKGTLDAKPGRALVVPKPPVDTAPTKAPEALPPAESDSTSTGPDAPGTGTLGVPDGDDRGVLGGHGVGDVGVEGNGDGDPVFITGDMERPVLLEKVEPSYPEVARRARIDGKVTVRAVIAPDGNVESVEVFASTNPLFDQAAVDAVRKWRYRPALMNGRPVRVYFSVVVSFRIR